VGAETSSPPGIDAGSSDAILNTILDGIGEGFYAVDRNWRIVLFNSEAALHFRRPREEMIGRSLWELFPKALESRLGQLFVKTMQSREPIRDEEESVIFPGQWMAFRLFPLGDGIGVVFRDTTDRRMAEAQRDLLITELGHRIRNTLALVHSIASQTFGAAGVDAAVRRSFEARLVALGNAHAVLTRRNWESADLGEVIRAAAAPHCAKDDARFSTQGPPVRLGPKTAVALAMAVHELCTNAVKYGALSVPAGRVEVSWTAEAGRMRLAWRERGGPQVVAPLHTGFGSLLIERSLAAQLQGRVTMEYAAEGLSCAIDAPLDAIQKN
jgi:PAS domain S-box-containing protein